jgi:hypothetical protein
MKIIGSPPTSESLERFVEIGYGFAIDVELHRPVLAREVD